MNHIVKKILEILLVFAAMSVYEFLWSLYIHNVRDEKYHHAGMFNVFILLSGALTTISYMNNYWMIVPAACGAYFGTWVSQHFYTKDQNK